MSKLYPNLSNIKINYANKSGNDFCHIKMYDKLISSNTNRKHDCIFYTVLFGMFAIFVLGSVGTVFMWFTNEFEHALNSQILIARNAANYEMWHHPTAKPYYKLYIYNYTNSEAFERGEVSKLKLQELGPYTYQMTLEKTKINFAKDNNTVNYQEYRNYKFVPSLSKGNLDDNIFIPNVPLFGVTSFNRHASFLTRLTISGALRGLDAGPFKNLEADTFLSGYQDNLLKITKGFLNFQDIKVYDNFGFFSPTIGTSSDVYTVNSGISDIDRIGIIEKFNNATDFQTIPIPAFSQDHPHPPDCSKFFENPSDGTLFPPHHIQAKKPINLYVKEFCRPIQFQYQGEERILNNEVPAARYHLTENSFLSPCYSDTNPDYHKQGHMRGLLNTTQCSVGAPVFFSLPHFYGVPGEKALLHDHLEGVNELRVRPSSYIDYHPRLGFLMGGRLRLQMNVQAIKAYGISQMNAFTDGMVLPLVWFEVGIDEENMSNELRELIYLATFTVRRVEIFLKYGSPAMVVMAVMGIALLLRVRGKREENTA